MTPHIRLHSNMKLQSTHGILLCIKYFSINTIF